MLLMLQLTGYYAVAVVLLKCEIALSLHTSAAVAAVREY